MPPAVAELKLASAQDDLRPPVLGARVHETLHSDARTRPVKMNGVLQISATLKPSIRTGDFFAGH
jgi:hypothetical protein